MNSKLGARLALAACAAAMTAGVSLANADGRFDGDGVELPREVVAAASAFSAYMDHAAAVSDKLASPAAVGDGLKAGAAYEPVQFEEGMVGYAAMAALQDDRFVAGVDDAGRRGDRHALAQRLAADPASVLQIDGAREAASRAQAALRERGDALFKTGGEVKQAAYDVQKQGWSTVTVTDAAERLARVKSLSGTAAAPAEGDDARLFKAVLQVHAPAGGAAAAVSPVVLRALALAADAVLGAARGEDLSSLKPLLSEASSAQCLKMSKLNLYQCMAVAGPQYEDVFCLGQHALKDTGQCVSAAAGALVDAKAAEPAPPAPVQVADRRYLVPVARRTVVASGE